MNRPSAATTRLPAIFLAAMFAAAKPALAIEDRADIEPSERSGAAVDYKFTPTAYFVRGEPAALDLNLRGTTGPHTAWAGFYRRGGEFQQARLGYERQFELPFGRLIASAQYATRGFWGGAATLEAGRELFGLIGWGRTNLKPYYNLNFDPNDSVLLGAGLRLPRDTVLTLFQVRDDRSASAQRITHFVFRTRAARTTRWTLDLFHKSGWTAEDDPVALRASGAALTFDYERYFARIAWDPRVNFTSSNMLRIAAGLRF
ncbi:MAG: hypothetical protein IT514_13655 [Burkholderiales bacterium]|nr:hypothetical protein [Burkholderiales bacterium]